LESEEDPNEVETFFVFLHKRAEIEARSRDKEERAPTLQQGPLHECSSGKPLLHLPRESPCRKMSLVFKGDETGTLDISEKIWIMFSLPATRTSID
ncbi:hypothetical protein T03_5560, partial [Trichinella britovi]